MANWSSSAWSIVSNCIWFWTGMGCKDGCACKFFFSSIASLCSSNCNFFSSRSNLISTRCSSQFFCWITLTISSFSLATEYLFPVCTNAIFQLRQTHENQQIFQCFQKVCQTLDPFAEPKTHTFWCWFGHSRLIRIRTGIVNSLIANSCITWHPCSWNSWKAGETWIHTFFSCNTIFQCNEKQRKTSDPKMYSLDKHTHQLQLKACEIDWWAHYSYLSNWQSIKWQLGNTFVHTLQSHIHCCVSFDLLCPWGAGYWCNITTCHPFFLCKKLSLFHFLCL